MEARFACGSMGRFFCHPAGGAILRHMGDHLIHVSTGRFAVFVHVAAFVVQTPTA